MNRFQVPTRHLDKHTKTCQSSCLWINITFGNVLSTSQINHTNTVTDNQIHRAHVFFTGSTMTDLQDHPGVLWDNSDDPGSSLHPPQRLIVLTSIWGQSHLQPCRIECHLTQLYHNTYQLKFNYSVSILPLTLSMFSWRQRKVWECVVMRRKSLQTAKEEMLEASWKRGPSTTYFPLALSLNVQAEELLNKCDRIPLCLQRTGGICLSGRADVPEDRRGENTNLYLHTVTCF